MQFGYIGNLHEMTGKNAAKEFKLEHPFYKSAWYDIRLVSSAF